MRENRTHGSEGGDGESRFRPLSEWEESRLQVDRFEIHRLRAEGCSMRLGLLNFTRTAVFLRVKRRSQRNNLFSTRC